MLQSGSATYLLTLGLESLTLKRRHVILTSDSAAAREAPVTEFATFIAANISHVQMLAMEDATLVLLDFCKEGPVSTFATGCQIEPLDHDSAPGGQTLAFIGRYGSLHEMLDILKYRREDGEDDGEDGDAGFENEDDEALEGLRSSESYEEIYGTYRRGIL